MLLEPCVSGSTQIAMTDGAGSHRPTSGSRSILYSYIDPKNMAFIVVAYQVVGVPIEGKLVEVLTSVGQGPYKSNSPFLTH